MYSSESMFGEHLQILLRARCAMTFCQDCARPFRRVQSRYLRCPWDLAIDGRRVSQQSGELSVIGIDDFAFRRGQTYGTIVCDLERRKPVTLLPDRALETSRTFLAAHPSARSFGRQVTAESWFEMCCAASASTCSAPGRAFSTPGCLG
ncbi:transposase [Novosphingobium sp. TW-4]|uniref:Transposase n=1 Tax=Novosphingobium olei TaxID=2728851 RepID=A0A7Y0BP11_9SPHN|nr:transposase [Novosphingobium olei]